MCTSTDTLFALLSPCLPPPHPIPLTPNIHTHTHACLFPSAFVCFALLPVYACNFPANPAVAALHRDMAVIIGICTAIANCKVLPQVSAMQLLLPLALWVSALLSP